MDFCDTYTTVPDEATANALIAASQGKPLSAEHPELVCQSAAIEQDHPAVGPSPPAPTTAPQIVRHNRMERQAPPPATTPGTIRVRLHYAPSVPGHPPQSAVVTSSGSAAGPRVVGTVTPETIAHHLGVKPPVTKPTPTTPPGTAPAKGSGAF